MVHEWRISLRPVQHNDNFFFHLQYSTEKESVQLTIALYFLPIVLSTCMTAIDNFIPFYVWSPDWKVWQNFVCCTGHSRTDSPTEPIWYSKGMYNLWLLKTLFKIVEASFKKKLNFDVCVVWWCSTGPINSQEYKSLEIYAVAIKISMTEYHHWINGLVDNLF